MNTLLYFVLGLVALLLLLTLIAPKSYDVFRVIEITGSKDTIFPFLQYLEKQRLWSPWAKKDPEMMHNLIGIDGTVGAVSTWKGNKDVGEGEQEITNVILGKSVEGQIRFLKPWKSQSDCYMNLEESTSTSCKVTWGFTGTTKFPFSIMMIFMSMDKMVGKDFKEGLKSLKKLIEA